jgi:polar amino acid transport system permease protein
VKTWVSYILAVFAVLTLIQFLVFNENWHWDVVGSYLFSQVVMEGLLRTIQLTFFITVLGLALGVVTAACRMSSLRVLRTAALLYIWVMRAMPPLVMLLLVFFFGALAPTISIGIPFGPSLPIASANDVITRFSAAVIGLAIYLGAYSGEILRGGILALPSGQFEACKSLGISSWKAYLHILGPQLVRVTTPSLANEIITMFKATSLVTVIGYAELLTTVQAIYSRNFQTIPLLAVAVIWYLVLTSIAMFGQSLLERRFSRGYSRRVQEQKAIADTTDRVGGLA